MNKIFNQISNPFFIIIMQILAILLMMVNESFFERLCFIVAFITIPYGIYVYRQSSETGNKMIILGLLALSNALLNSAHPISFKMLSVALVVIHGIYIGRSMTTNRQIVNTSY